MVTTETSARPRVPEAAPTPAGRRAGKVRLPRQPLAFVCALVFFFAPLVAYVLGARPQAIENRALADLPSVSDGWSFFPDFTTWAVDHLPLRAQAVRANAELSETLFNEAPSFQSGTAENPYPPVIQGEDGWLYLGADAQSLCEPVHGLEETFDRLNRLARAVEDSGRRFVLVVAPDKSTIYPDALPDTFVGQECATARRTAFWDALATNPPAGYLDLRTGLEAVQESTGAPVYRQTDTHWGPRGAALFAEELARTLDPELLTDTEFVETGDVRHTGDLGRMIGLPHEDTFAGVAVERPGVSPVGRDSLDLPTMPYSPVTITNRTTDAALFEPSTLLLGDSFASASGEQLGPFFEDVTVLHNEVAAPYPQAVANLMADSDVVVVEIVERTVAAGGGALIQDAALQAIEETLAQQPR